MDRVARAIEIAAQVHAGQVDKGGTPYIMHCLHVMHTVEVEGQWLSNEDAEDLRIVAVLHDAIEDFKGGPGEKAEFRDMLIKTFGSRVFDALVRLTRRKDEKSDDDYMSSYIKRISEGPLAVRVKIADLTHNMDPTRLPTGRQLTQKDLLRWDKYRRALIFLKTGTLIEPAVIHAPPPIQRDTSLGALPPRPSR